MSRIREKRQAVYSMKDIVMSLAGRCEDYKHKLGNGTFDDPYAWLFVRTAEVTRKAQRNHCMIREPVSELLEEGKK